jgi:hypothetical protein
VAPLFDPVAIQNGDWERIAKNVEIVLANVRAEGPKIEQHNSQNFAGIEQFLGSAQLKLAGILPKFWK